MVVTIYDIEWDTDDPKELSELENEISFVPNDWFEEYDVENPSELTIFQIGKMVESRVKKEVDESGIPIEDYEIRVDF